MAENNVASLNYELIYLISVAQLHDYALQTLLRFSYNVHSGITNNSFSVTNFVERELI